MEALWVLLMNAADNPSSRNCCTWSCINEISGETTMLNPPPTAAGN